jgi:hypothetical protein
MTGKNSIAGHPKYKLKGRVALASPFQSICNQTAKEAWNEQNRPNQLFVHSKMQELLNSFKKKKEDINRINVETTLKGIDLPKSGSIPKVVEYIKNKELCKKSFYVFRHFIIDCKIFIARSIG